MSDKFPKIFGDQVYSYLTAVEKLDNKSATAATSLIAEYYEDRLLVDEHMLPLYLRKIIYGCIAGAIHISATIDGIEKTIEADGGESN